MPARSGAGRLLLVRLLPGLLLVLGCGLQDSALVECRCTPDTNHALFPGCPRMVAVEASDGKGWVTAVGDTLKVYWITAAGDTLDPDADWVLVKGTAVRWAGPVGSGGPLATGVPECPSGQPLNLLERTRPAYVLLNLQRVFESESRNVSQYLDQLAANFTFVPDPLDVQNHPEVYAVGADTLWGRDQERAFAQAVLDPERIRAIHFTRWYESSRDQRIISEDQLLETFIFPYEVEFTEPPGPDGEARVVVIKGWSEIDLVTPTLENPVWELRQWRDRRDAATAKFSWGELRAEFAR